MQQVGQEDFINTGTGVWFFRTDLKLQNRAALWSLLSWQEKAAVARFRLEADRARSIVARARLRLVLAEISGFEATTFEFAKTARGKPLLTDPPETAGLHFNLTHSGDYCAIAVSRVSPVGIDIERVRSGLELSTVYISEFSISEADWIASLPEPDRPRAFSRVWTRKEAVLKAEGSGLSIALNQFDALGDHVAIGSKTFSVRDLHAPEGYAASLAQQTCSD